MTTKLEATTTDAVYVSYNLMQQLVAEWVLYENDRQRYLSSVPQLTDEEFEDIEGLPDILYHQEREWMLRSRMEAPEYRDLARAYRAAVGYQQGAVVALRALVQAGALDLHEITVRALAKAVREGLGTK